MTDYRVQLKAAICANWDVCQPEDETGPLSLLLSNLTRIAESGKTISASPVPFQGTNIPATRRELRQVIEGADLTTMHQTTRLAAAKAGISPQNLRSLSEEERNLRLEQAIKELSSKPGAKRPSGSDDRGRKINPLARNVAQMLISAFKPITGRSPGVSGADRGLAPAAREVFKILGIEANARAAIQTALENPPPKPQGLDEIKEQINDLTKQIEKLKRQRRREYRRGNLDQNQISMPTQKEINLTNKRYYLKLSLK